MNDISDLEARISSALDRIGASLMDVSATHEPATDVGKVAELEAALEAERTANAQLEERVVAIKQKQETVVITLESEVGRLNEVLAQKDEENERLKNVNGRLRRNNRALRDANSQGLGDPDLINDSMGAELDALRVSRDADRAELDSILGELMPLVEGAQSARG